MNDIKDKCVTTLRAWWGVMDRQDTVFVLTTIITLIVWWVVLGRRKYSTKGMR